MYQVSGLLAHHPGASGGRTNEREKLTHEKGAVRTDSTVFFAVPTFKVKVREPQSLESVFTWHRKEHAPLTIGGGHFPPPSNSTASRWLGTGSEVSEKQSSGLARDS